MNIADRIQVAARLSFVTPAFLGGADQEAQWRTPPIKALLRRWWRIAFCGGRAVEVKELRDAEARLFGWAGEDGASASAVRVRLSDWRGGTESAAKWSRYKFGNAGSSAVRADLYLGYGPLQPKSGSRGSVPGAEHSFIAEGTEPRSLTVCYPRAESQRMEATLRMVQLFGTLGSRSRNAWGSVHLEPVSGEDAKQLLSIDAISAMLEPSAKAARDWLRPLGRDWQDAVSGGDALDWCHAIGLDPRGLLLWRTDAQKSWEHVINRLAAVKKAFRRAIRKGLSRTDLTLVAYPVTKVTREEWGKNARSANQVLFKVLRLADSSYAGIVVHLPHDLPRPLRCKLAGTAMTLRGRQQQVWQLVHKTLDQELTRLP